MFNPNFFSAETYDEWDRSLIVHMNDCSIKIILLKVMLIFLSLCLIYLLDYLFSVFNNLLVVYE